MNYYRINEIRTYMLFLSLFLFLYACKEDVGITVNKIGVVPGNVTNVQFTPTSGGAILHYDLPSSDDLRYVKATYTLDNGIVREAKSSIYKNEIIIDGFGQEGEYDIKLQSVSVGEVMSEAMTIRINVLRPPYLVVLDEIIADSNIGATFGGFNIDYVNTSKANLVIRVVKKDDDGRWNPVNNTYTNYERGRIRVRGQESELSNFGLFIEDRWSHKSDVYSFSVHPLEEVDIPADNWARFVLPFDAGVRGASFPFNGIWDGDINKGYLSIANANSATESVALPNSITIDLRIPVLLSRMQIWATRSATAADVYGASHIYDFEIYGSNAPNPSGEWDNTWTSLGRFVSSRPSGFGFGVPATAEELTEIRENGETYEFPDPTGHEKFRYIRFKNYATWAGAYEGNQNFFIYELFLFGQL